MRGYFRHSLDVIESLEGNSNTYVEAQRVMGVLLGQLRRELSNHNWHEVCEILIYRFKDGETLLFKQNKKEGAINLLKELSKSNAPANIIYTVLSANLMLTDRVDQGREYGTELLKIIHDLTTKVNGNTIFSMKIKVLGISVLCQLNALPAEIMHACDAVYTKVNWLNNYDYSPDDIVELLDILEQTSIHYAQAAIEQYMHRSRRHEVEADDLCQTASVRNENFQNLKTEWCDGRGRGRLEQKKLAKYIDEMTKADVNGNYSVTMDKISLGEGKEMKDEPVQRAASASGLGSYSMWGKQQASANAHRDFVASNEMDDDTDIDSDDDTEIEQDSDPDSSIRPSDL